ncbi:MAG: hypothetical protein J5764_06195 [Bacteroidales bacterium]|nr:hypothetical protein [Bacteroidales bacterium]
MKKLFSVLALALLFVTGGIAAGQGFSAPSLEYMGTQMDGSITVRVTASGRNYKDAIDQARKFALKQTLFRGIRTGDPLLSKPLVTEVNAEEKYQTFFNAFFADTGVFSNFVSSEDKRLGSNERVGGKIQVKVVSTIRVLRPQLKQYLLDNEILKP